MRATEVRTSPSHPATEMTTTNVTAAKVTSSAKMAAAAVTTSTTSRGRIGRTRNHDRKNDNSQEIEL
jgi:hypothetical protein